MESPMAPQNGASKYPIARRVLAAIVMICFSTWELSRAKHVTILEVLVVLVLVTAALSKPWSRFFWFLLGSAVGIFLGLIGPQLHF